MMGMTESRLLLAPTKLCLAACLLMTSTTLLAGCAGTQAENCEEDPDAGDGGSCASRGEGTDGSQFDSPPGDPNFAGDGDFTTEDEDDTCFALVSKACGAGNSTCQSAPGCTAARLTADWTPEDCASALDNDVSYPPCEASACELLVEKVCGQGGAAGDCAGTSGCEPALQLQERAQTAPSGAERDDAEGACAAALADEAVFAACGEKP